MITTNTVHCTHDSGSPYSVYSTHELGFPITTYSVHTTMVPLIVYTVHMIQVPYPYTLQTRLKYISFYREDSILYTWLSFP